MKYRFKTKPYPHQVKATKALVKRRGGGLYVPMRYGKSKIVVDTANIFHLLEGIERVLWVTTISGIGVAEAEVRKHTPDELVGALTWKIINFEATYDRLQFDDGWRPVDNEDLRAYDPDLVIVDECHHIGKPSTVQSVHVYKLGQLADFRIFMTGSPWHRKAFYVFGAFRFYDDSIFGTNFGNFKERHGRWGGYQKRELKGYRRMRELKRRMKPHVTVKQHVPKMAPEDVVVSVSLGESRAVYDEMEKESIVTVGGDEIMADIILTKHLRCAQITGGWIKPTDGSYRRVGREKQRMFKDDLREMQEADVTKLVVGCRFLPELNDITEVCRELEYNVILMHGGVKKGYERDRRFAAFNETEKPTVFVSQMAAAREAVDLSAASFMTFYSLPEDYLTYDQFRARISVFNDTRTLQYRHLIARGTRDQVTWLALRMQQDVARLLWKKPELVERITAKR